MATIKIITQTNNPDVAIKNSSIYLNFFFNLLQQRGDRHLTMEPRIETARSGQKILICYYVGDRYNEAIEQAEQLHGVVGDAAVTVIALPVGIGNDNKG